MKSYPVRRVSGEVALDGNAAGRPWADLPALEIGCFPWHRRGRKQATRVKLCWTEGALHLLFECEDAHISATRTGLNSDVYRDSCVEFFASLHGDPSRYFNMEYSCCGVLHMGYGPDRRHRRLVTATLAAGLETFHSAHGPPRNESPDDDGWTLHVRAPFQVLARFTRRPVEIAPGAVWRANFYRCGGRTDAQYACWNPVGVPRPDFHRPECFGVLRFCG